MKTSIKIMLIILPLWLSESIAVAQGDEQFITLQKALQYALEHNASIKKSVIDVEEGKEYTREVKSQGLPQVDASLRYTNNYALPVSIIPAGSFPGFDEDLVATFGTQHNAIAGIEANQLLFNKAYFTGLKAANESEALYQLQLKQSKEDVILDVATYFYNTFITKAQIDVVEADIERFTRLIDITQLQYENDLVKKVELNRLKVSKTNLEVQLKQLNTTYEQQSNLLKYYMGLPIENEIKLEDNNQALETSMITNSGFSNLNQRTELQLLNSQKSLQALEIKSIQSEYFPTLSLFFNFNYQAQRQEFNFFDQSRRWFDYGAVGVNLSVPIFDGFNKNARAQQARLRQEKTNIDFQDTQEYLSLEYQNAANQLENSKNAKEAQESNVVLAREVMQVTYDLYQEALAPLTDLLEAESTLREAQSSYNQSDLNYKIAQLNLLKAKGEILTLVN